MEIAIWITLVLSLVAVVKGPYAAVYIDDFTTEPRFINLVEGTKANVVTFDATASSTVNSHPLLGVGFNHWTVSFWGSKNPNGTEPRLNPQAQILSPYHASKGLFNPGDKIKMRKLFTYFDMTDLKCSDVPYLCAEFNMDPNSYPPLELRIPFKMDKSILIDCFSVPEYSCKGVIAADLDFDMSFDKIIPNAPVKVSFDIHVSTSNQGVLNTSSGAVGNNLWRVGFFTSPDPLGTEKHNYDPQILTSAQSSQDLRPFDALKLRHVNTQVDLTDIGCEDNMKYVCLEFAKGLQATPDFKFEVTGGGKTLIKCEEQECKLVEG